MTKLGFHIVFLQTETYNPINLIIVDNWDKKAGHAVDRLKSQKLHFNSSPSDVDLPSTLL